MILLSRMPDAASVSLRAVSRDSRVCLADHAIELLLEAGDLALERVLALAEHLRLLHAIGTGLRQAAARRRRCPAALAAISSAWRCASRDVALAARGLVAWSAAAALRAAVRRPPRPGRPLTDRRSRRRGASHRPRCASGARCRRGPGDSDRATAVSSWRAASSACSASARCRSPPLPPADWPAAMPALPLDFLLLPARQLLQLLGELVDLLILLLRSRPASWSRTGSPSCPFRA